MSLLTIANLLLIFAFCTYFIHAYFRNTVDFQHYRRLLRVPAVNQFEKYVYAHSFFLFVIAVLAFVASTVLSSFAIPTLLGRRVIFALSVLLAIGAVRMIMLPDMSRWRMRAQ